MDYIITTDTTSDLPEEYVKKHDLHLLSFNYIVNDVSYNIDNELPHKEFYNKMRDGSVPITSQVNPGYAKEFFQSCIAKYDTNILHIGFSSGLSGSYNNTMVAALEVMEENPGRKIIVVDSLGASLGQGLLVHKAVKLKEQGQSIDKVYNWLEANKLNLCHYFTVDDLVYLYRGGRVSKTSAYAAGVLNIKPILHIDNEGHLVALSKTRGRKKSLKELADIMEKRILPGEEDIFISHSDCMEDAESLAKNIKERFNIEPLIISHIGPTIGAHTGPGTVAVFYMGRER